MKKIPLLEAKDIEVKIKQVKEKGAIALLYKTARTDMNILDEVFGPENWQDDYKEIKGNLYCGIGTRESEEKPFVWKWDCGIESREDEEGNQKKGEASDAFKRAGTKWGIGRELYSAPFIFLNVATIKETKNGKDYYKLANPFVNYEVSEITYNEDRTIKSLTIVDDKGNVVFGKGAKKEQKEMLTLAKAENMTLKDRAGNELKLKNLGLGQLERLLTNEEYKEYHEAVKLILEFKANA